MHFKLKQTKQLQIRILTVLAVVGVGLVGVHLAGYSFAFTDNNPYGYADSCALSGNTTIIYGWANDPQAPLGSSPSVQVVVGGNAVTVESDISGYRDSQINTYIKDKYPDQPTTGEYGFQANFTNLYKGHSYPISGTIINVGVGANAALSIDSSYNVDGDTSKPYFSGGAIPDTCLATAPVVVTPTPTPTPTPSPSPTPAPKSSPTPTKTTTTTKSSTTTTTATPTTPTPAADGTSVLGTTSAVITVPADGASQIQLTYSINGGPVQTTPEQTVSGSSATITLTDLSAETSYTYQIVRTNSSGTSATSVAAVFTTHGYEIAMQFIDSHNKPVSGIKSTINDATNSQDTSDKTGKISFINLPAAAYAVSFVYHGQTYSQDFDTSSFNGSQINSNGSPAQLTLTDTVNVDSLSLTSAKSKTTSKQGSHGTGWLVIILLVVFVAALVAFIRFRKHRSNRLAPLNVDIIDRHSHEHFKKHPPTPEPPPAHMGQSLSDMVIQAMREEAQRRKNK